MPVTLCTETSTISPANKPRDWFINERSQLRTIIRIHYAELRRQTFEIIIGAVMRRKRRQVSRFKYVSYQESEPKTQYFETPCGVKVRTTILMRPFQGGRIRRCTPSSVRPVVRLNLQVFLFDIVFILQEIFQNPLMLPFVRCSFQLNLPLVRNSKLQSTTDLRTELRSECRIVQLQSISVESNERH